MVAAIHEFAIVIFSGMQLLALGIIGEYLARMHFPP